MFSNKGFAALVIVAIVAGFVIAHYVYGDWRCVVAECRIVK